MLNHLLLEFTILTYSLSSVTWYWFVSKHCCIIDCMNSDLTINHTSFSFPDLATMIYRWQSWGNGVQSAFLHQFPSFSFSFQSLKVNILLEYIETCLFVVPFLGVPYIEVLTVLLEKIVQMLRNNPNIIVAVATLPLVCLVHPAIGLGLLLLSHAFHAHSNLCRFVFNF